MILYIGNSVEGGWSTIPQRWFFHENDMSGILRVTDSDRWWVFLGDFSFNHRIDKKNCCV